MTILFNLVKIFRRPGSIPNDYPIFSTGAFGFLIALLIARHYPIVGWGAGIFFGLLIIIGSFEEDRRFDMGIWKTLFFWKNDR